MSFLDKLLGGGGQQNVTSTINRTPGQYDPYYQDILAQAQNLNRTQSPTYSNLYAGQSAQTQQGVQELGAYDPAASQASQQYLQDVLGGNYLNNNPYLDQTFNRAADQTQARLGSAYAGAGRSGSGAYYNASGDAYGNLANQIYGGNYQMERNRQQQAAGMAPGVDQGVLTGAQAQLTAGGINDADYQAYLNERERGANFGYNSAWDNLSRYLGAVSTATEPYGQQTQTVPYFQQGRGQGILGGAIGGGQFGSQFNGQGGTPWGTIIGAVGGGLLGGSG